ncbi:TPA: hypothetical protein OYH96_002844 [Staphylococcus aureus]|nr:hypothetical protein [Staphylococcus aureus]HCW8076628.1 hypothetical protein [Staphylococcus aureus]
MALNKGNKLINKAQNQSTKKYNEDELNKNKSTSMRISADVKSQLEDVQFDIMANKRIHLSLSETVQTLIDHYNDTK